MAGTMWCSGNSFIIIVGSAEPQFFSSIKSMIPSNHIEKKRSAFHLIRNIVVEDKRPTLQHFMVAMEGVEPWSNPERKRDPGDLFGILFQVGDASSTFSFQ